GLLAGRAAAVPDGEGGIGAQDRYHAGPKGLEEAGVSEHLGDPDREASEDRGEEGGVGDTAALELADVGEAGPADGGRHAAAQRRESVAAKVVPVALKDRFQEMAKIGGRFQLGLKHRRPPFRLAGRSTWRAGDHRRSVWGGSRSLRPPGSCRRPPSSPWR